MSGFNSLENPATDSSSGEEEMESSSGEGEEVDGNSSSEEEVDESSRKSVLKKRETVLSEKNHVSDSESGSEEESDHDSETERKDPVKNPGRSVVKSVAVTQDSKKGKSSTKKRSMDGAAAASTDAKRVKRSSGEDDKKTSGGGEEAKKLYFQRVWSEEDEILVLKRIIDYKTDNKVSPFDDTNAFYQLVKESISFGVSKTQFTKKLRTLRKKFENNIGKAKKGEEPTFSKPHDRKAFELSKFIWGANGIAPESTVKSSGKSKKSSKSKKVVYVKQETEDEVTNKGQVYSSLGGMTELDTTFTKSCLVKSLARFGVDDLVAQQGWTRLTSEDKKRFEFQWNKMQLEFYTQNIGFIHEVVTKMAEAFRSNP